MLTPDLCRNLPRLRTYRTAGKIPDSDPPPPTIPSHDRDSLRPAAWPRGRGPVAVKGRSLHAAGHCRDLVPGVNAPTTRVNGDDVGIMAVRTLPRARDQGVRNSLRPRADGLF